MTTSAVQTEAILAHHLEMFTTTDLDGIMSDFTESSVLIAQDQTCKGLAEIRAFFEAMFPAVTPEFLAGFNMAKQEIAGDVAYIVWSVKGFFALGTDTFVIKDGKIAVQTLSTHPAS